MTSLVAVMYFLAILISFLSIARNAIAFEFSANRQVNSTRGAILTPGDILFGGLFPIHTGTATNTTKQCMKLDHERGIHRLEAMLYAIDVINSNSSFLPARSIGVNIRDTCGVDTHALEEAVHFLKGYRGNGDQCGSSGSASTLFGVIGAASSGVSIQVANLLRLFEIPQISYASTSPDLNDRQKYDYFLRTVPADTYQAQAMIDVVRYFNWSSVQGLYSDGNYGQKGMEVFKKLAKTAGVCIVSSSSVDEQTDFASIVEGFTKFPTSRTVVLFLSTDHVTLLLRAVQSKLALATTKLQKDKYRFKWLASDFWGTRSQFIKEGGLYDAAKGAIVLTLQTSKVSGFENYFRNLTPANNKRNKWFPTFWEETHGCTFSNISRYENRVCTGNETLPSSYLFDDKVPYVIDAVFALAHAVDSVIRKYCDGVSCELSSLTGKTVLDVLQRNVSFTGELGKMKFDENGSTVREYEIFEFVGGSHEVYKKLGSWIHKLKDMKARTHITSSCSEICKRGQSKIPKHDVTCCFTCKDCHDNEYVKGMTRVTYFPFSNF